MKVYTYTDEDLTRLANQVKESMLAFLVNEGHLALSVEEYEDFCGSHVVLLARPGMFGRLWDKVRGLTDENYYIVTVMKSPLRAERPNAPVIKLIKDEE